MFVCNGTILKVKFCVFELRFSLHKLHCVCDLAKLQFGLDISLTNVVQCNVKLNIESPRRKLKLNKSSWKSNGNHWANCDHYHFKVGLLRHCNNNTLLIRTFTSCKFDLIVVGRNNHCKLQVAFEISF